MPSIFYFRARINISGSSSSACAIDYTKLNAYLVCAIRMRLPNRHVVDEFSSGENIIEDPVSEAVFYYTSVCFYAKQ